MNYSANSKRFLTISQVMTRDGKKSVKIILDVEENIFYTYDDDENFTKIGSHFDIITGFSNNNIITLIKNNGEKINIDYQPVVVTTPITTNKPTTIKKVDMECNERQNNIPICRVIREYYEHI